MTPTKTQPRIAILVANGFDENHITAVQRAMTQAGIGYRIIAPEQGLVNGWQGSNWGHYFTVDEMVGAAMGSDYDFLILPGGDRAIAKLKTNPHTRRILNHFLEAEKLVAAIGAGVSLLALSPKSAGLSVVSDPAFVQELKDAQIERAEGEVCLDRYVLTSDGTTVEPWIGALMERISLYEPILEAEVEAA